jgi:hypothetical protein
MEAGQGDSPAPLLKESKMSKLFTMKVGEEDLEKFKEIAKAHDLPLSSYIKLLLRNEPIPEPKRQKVKQADPELIRQIAGIGNNLNQISRHLNQGGALDVDVLYELVQIRKELSRLKC